MNSQNRCTPHKKKESGKIVDADADAENVEEEGRRRTNPLIEVENGESRGRIEPTDTLPTKR